MLANAILQFAPTMEATFDSTPSLCMADIDTSLSNCEALGWAVHVLYFAGCIGTARKQARFTATPLLCLLNGT